MFVFVLSSRGPRLCALPQDLSTRPFCVWFCTKHLCFCFGGQGMACWPSSYPTGHGLRPPAVFCCHRPNVWPTGTLDGRPAIYFGQLHFWLADHCSSAFADIFRQLSCFCIPPYTCMEGSPSCKACLVSFTRQYREELSLRQKRGLRLES